MPHQHLMGMFVMINRISYLYSKKTTQDSIAASNKGLEAGHILTFSHKMPLDIYRYKYNV